MAPAENCHRAAVPLSQGGFLPTRRMAFEGQLVLDASAFPALSGFRLVSSEQVRGGQGVPVRVAHPDPGLQLTFAPDGPLPGGWYQLELRFPPEGLVDVVAKLVFAGDRVLWRRLPLL